jgi:hypothetical protein
MAATPRLGVNVRANVEEVFLHGVNALPCRRAALVTLVT